MRFEDLIKYIKENFKEKPSIHFIDEDGFPIAYAVDVEISHEIIIKTPKYLNIKDKEVNLVFNHITEIPSGGYTDRRYIVIRGKVQDIEGNLVLKPTKYYNWDEKQLPFVSYCEKNVNRAKEYLEKLSKLKGKPIKPKIGVFWFVFKTLRLPFLIASILPALIGIMIAINEGYIDLTSAFLIVIGVALIHAALNVANDYHDHITGADVINLTPTPFSGGSRVIQHGLIEPSTSFKIFSSLYIAGIAIGLYFTLLRGIWVLVLMSIGVFISYFYSAKPLRFAEKGLGEIMVGIGFGPIITLGSYVAITGKLSFIPLLVSIPIGTLIALILYVNEIPDREWDIKAGKLTLVARMKKENIAKGYLIGIIITYLSYVLCLFLRALPIYSLVVLALLPLAIKVYKGIKSGYHDPYSMIPVCAAHINFYIYFALLVLLSLILNLMLVNLPL
jgi:1,4-dihydroxy-2-naphthoate octaprenyltransferase